MRAFPIDDPLWEELMAHTHEFDCIICGAHFDNDADLARHSDAEHMKNAQGMEKPRETHKPDRNGDEGMKA